MKNKSLAVYGINIPRIVNVLPTNLPVIKANELRLDNLFELEDGTFALLDYESAYKPENKIKYLDYIVRILRRYEKVPSVNMRVRMIVIYTADVEENSTKNAMDIGCLNFQIEEAFLSKLETKKIWGRISEKIRNEIPLTDEEMMEFIILPLTCKGKEGKQQIIRQGFELSKRITDPEIQLFVVSGMLVFSDKVINDTDAEQIRRWIRMTKVGRLFLEEMEAAVEAAQKETEEKIARRMLEKGTTIEDIADAMDVLTVSDIERIALELGVMTLN